MTKTVLIADKNLTFAEALAKRCQELGIDTKVYGDGLAAFQAILQQAPDLLILEVELPGADGIALCEQLVANQELPPIPAVVLTAEANDETVARCDALGVHYVWKGLDTWETLAPLIQRLLDITPGGAVPETPATPAEADAPPAAPRVLVVDDDPNISKAIQIRLRAYGVEVLRAFSGMQGYWTALREHPDAIVMDFRMPEGYGNYLLGKLRGHSLTRNTPVIVLTGQSIGSHKDFALERDLMQLGAAAYLTKPLDFHILVEELSRHIQIPQPTAAAK